MNSELSAEVRLVLPTRTELDAVLRIKSVKRGTRKNVSPGNKRQAPCELKIGLLEALTRTAGGCTIEWGAI